jgi:hypothetical protein
MDKDGKKFLSTIKALNPTNKGKKLSKKFRDVPIM